MLQNLNLLLHICILLIKEISPLIQNVSLTPLTNKIIILGGGPNRIGQGIEFDYCCCQASFALKEAKYETIMVNCNPETVSTDYDTSDRLYFEPLIDEYVFNIIKKEKSKGNVKGLIHTIRRSNSNKTCKIFT